MNWFTKQEEQEPRASFSDDYKKQKDQTLFSLIIVGGFIFYLLSGPPPKKPPKTGKNISIKDKKYQRKKGPPAKIDKIDWNPSAPKTAKPRPTESRKIINFKKDYTPKDT